MATEVSHKRGEDTIRVVAASSSTATEMTTATTVASISCTSTASDGCTTTNCKGKSASVPASSDSNHVHDRDLKCGCVARDHQLPRCPNDVVFLHLIRNDCDEIMFTKCVVLLYQQTIALGRAFIALNAPSYITRALIAVATTSVATPSTSAATSTTASATGLSADEISTRVMASSALVTFVVFDYYTPPAPSPSSPSTSPSHQQHHHHEWPYHLLPPTHCFMFQRSTDDKWGRYIRGEDDWHQIDWSCHGTYDTTLLDHVHDLMHSVRDYCLMHIFDTPTSSSGSDEPPSKLLADWAYLLALDTWLLLDTRRLTLTPKRFHRPYYHAYKARISAQYAEPVFKGSIVPIDPTRGYTVNRELAKASACHFSTIDQPFDQNYFGQPRHPPYLVGWLEDRKSFTAPLANVDEASRWNLQDMPIKFPGTGYRLPDELKNVAGEFTQRVAECYASLAKNHDDMYCYLTMTVGVVDPWLTQRRPGLHGDGFKSINHPPGELNEHIFLAINTLPTHFYNEAWDVAHLDPGKDDFWVYFAQRTTRAYWEGMKPFGIYMVDGHNLHAVVTNKSLVSVPRVFIRLMYSTSKYDRIGNAHNSLFDYAWPMKPAATQMPPPFWGARNAQLDEDLKSAPRPPPRLSTPVIGRGTAGTDSAVDDKDKPAGMTATATATAIASSSGSSGGSSSSTITPVATPLPPVPLAGVYYSDGSYGPPPSSTSPTA